MLNNNRCKFVQLLYTGKSTIYSYNIPGIIDDANKSFTKPTKIVLSLIDSLLGKGYILGIDNFYTSSELINILVERKTDVIGTVRFNKKNTCPEVKKKL